MDLIQTDLCENFGEPVENFPISQESRLSPLSQCIASFGWGAPRMKPGLKDLGDFLLRVAYDLCPVENISVSPLSLRRFRVISREILGRVNKVRGADNANYPARKWFPET